MMIRQTLQLHLKPFFSIHFIFIVVFYWICVLSLFRWMEHNDLNQLKTSIEGILRDEYLNANSYLVSKKLSDLEQLKLIQCVRLVEQAPLERVYYNTTTSQNCHPLRTLSPLMTKETEFTALNGLTYQLSFQRPTQWQNIILEIIFTFGGLFLIAILTEKQFSEKQKAIERFRTLEIEKEIMQDLTTQVRHDIASPLMAIQAVAHIAEFDSRYKDLLLKAVQRTEKIFSDLKSLKISPSDLSLQSNKSINIKTNFKKNLETFDLKTVVEGLQKEKEITWKNTKNAPDVLFYSQSQSCFVYGQEIELARIVSNLFNNSWEARQEGKNLKIRWSITKHNQWSCLSIEDNGKGIHPSVLKQLGLKGLSWGKPSMDPSCATGSGRGLYHAKTTLKRWGGKIKIESTLGKGTTVVLYFKSYV